jgi:hypothetical protein
MVVGAVFVGRSGLKARLDAELVIIEYSWERSQQ